MEPNKDQELVGELEQPKPFRWNKTREKAALLEARRGKELTDGQMAKRLGVTRQTLHNWRQYPEYQNHVQDLRLQIRQRIMETGLADVVRRVEFVQERYKLLRSIYMERRRAAQRDPALGAIPGMKSGFMVRQQKVIGVGAAAQRIDEYVTDAGLSRELRELEKHMMAMLGQWVEKIAPTTPDGSHEYGTEQNELLTEEYKRQLLAAFCARLGVAIDGAGGIREDPAADRSGPPMVGWDGRDATSGVPAGPLAGVPAYLSVPPDHSSLQPADREDIQYGGSLPGDGNH